MAGCEAIRSARKRKNLTQEALGKELGVTGITVSRWETGARLVDKTLVPAVAETLNLQPREIRPDLAELIGGAQ
jgi:transcriptional regulator with XRE-family HTH domain